MSPWRSVWRRRGLIAMSSSAGIRSMSKYLINKKLNLVVSTFSASIPYSYVCVGVERESA